MEQTIKENSITQGVIWKQLLIFFFPILIGTFFQQLYNTVDTIVVGQYVGTQALAAVGTTSNLIKLQENCMEVTKRGLTNTHMVFEEQKKNMTYYDTPFGNLLVGIAATNVSMKESEEQIDVKVNYALEINYEHLADCTIDVKVRSRDGGQLHIGG